MDKNTNRSSNFSILCWNIANPSIERASKQAEWLRKRSEDIFILTEAKKSKGCIFIERYFQAYGYNVIFPKPEGKEFGVIIISKHILLPSDFSSRVNFLQARVVSVKLEYLSQEIEIIGTYVPSRDSSPEKIEKKMRFLKILSNAFETAPSGFVRIFCGDLNILEPNHIPHYSFFKEWEYDFYRDLTMKYQIKDVFRHLYPLIHEYSWVGRTGDGYRYDYCFVSEKLLSQVKNCYYFHEPRETKLSDHSAVIMEIEIYSV